MINTSSESFCNAAMESLANKNCYLLLPNLETLGQLYPYKNVVFYKKGSPQELAIRLDELIKKITTQKHSYNFPDFPYEFKLEVAAKKYINLYQYLFK